MEKVIKSLAMVVAVVMMVVVVDGQGLCNMSPDDLRACKPAITSPGPCAPTRACCTGLGKANLQCMCSYKGSSLLSMFGIDPDLAMQLPSKCGIAPPTNC